MHANLRGESGIVAGDSIQSPCSPHGLTGLHREAGELSVVELESVTIAAAVEDVEEGTDGVACADQELEDAARLAIRDKSIFLWKTFILCTLCSRKNCS